MAPVKELDQPIVDGHSNVPYTVAVVCRVPKRNPSSNADDGTASGFGAVGCASVCGRSSCRTRSPQSEFVNTVGQNMCPLHAPLQVSKTFCRTGLSECTDAQE